MDVYKASFLFSQSFFFYLSQKQKVIKKIFCTNIRGCKSVLLKNMVIMTLLNVFIDILMLFS